MSNQKDRSHDVIRMAVRLRERLLDAQVPALISLPEAKWRECQRLARMHEKALSKGWFVAAETIRPRLIRALRDFRETLTQMLAGQAQEMPHACLSLRELHADLLGLFDEFSTVEPDLRGRTLSVITEPVVLEDVYLGPFRIELELDSGENGFRYDVIAIDPNPPASDEDVTHPHVRDNCLCEGEGILPIRRALSEGRLSDFFQIVTQILHSYNPGSAYVALGEWMGVSCTACGASVCDDERTSCSRTCDPLCYECAVTCPDCDQDFSPDLVERCQKCDEDHCNRCLDEGLCHDCRKEAEEEEALAEQEAETPSIGCGGQSVHLEQTESLGAGVG